MDGLHRAAGSRRVFQIHGSIARVRCTSCGQVEDRPGETLPDLPRCKGCGQLLRPDVRVVRGALPEAIWEQAVECVRVCQCCLVVGTSAIVYPAAGLVDLARRHGAQVIEVNLTSTPATDLADVGLYAVRPGAAPAGGKTGKVMVRRRGRVDDGTQILDGKKLAETMQAEIAAEAAAFTARHGRRPGLAAVLVGNNPASQIYVPTAPRLRKSGHR